MKELGSNLSIDSVDGSNVGPLQNVNDGNPSKVIGSQSKILSPQKQSKRTNEETASTHKIFHVVGGLFWTICILATLMVPFCMNEDNTSFLFFQAQPADVNGINQIKETYIIQVRNKCRITN